MQCNFLDVITIHYFPVSWDIRATLDIISIAIFDFRKKDITTESSDVSILNWVFGFYFLDKFSILTLQQTATKKPPATSTDGK